VVANTGFGAAAASNNAQTFGSLSSATPTFGSLGGGSSGGGQSTFGAASSGGFGGFGSSGGGSTSPPPAGAQFSSWR